MISQIKYRGQQSLSEGVGSVGFEDGVIAFVAGPGSGSENGKLDVLSSELEGLWSSDFLSLIEDSSSDDGDCVGRCSVVTGHFSVQLTDCSVEGDVSVLLVHVVVSSS